MTGESARIWDYIEKFRRSEYYQQVIGQGYLAKWAGILIETYLEDSDEEFTEGLREILISNTMLASRTVGPFFESNSTESLRTAFMQFHAEEVDTVEFIDTFLELDKCGIFIASHMLSFATAGAYIIYHDLVYDALVELFPYLEDSLDRVTDGASFAYFQMACDMIMQSYRFTSAQELHEFLWHGKDTNWEFD